MYFFYAEYLCLFQHRKHNGENKEEGQKHVIDAKPIEEIKQDWGQSRFPTFIATATTAKGVFETFECLNRMAFETLNKRYGFDKKFGFQMGDFLESLMTEKIKSTVNMEDAMITPGAFRM